ncbi:MAG: hypothetical protein KME14_09780 [Tildeniella torsiva UHER 1998/13D]|nr:hypothetical protein [Tildeniella torsiva UHER 1998/13D]
MHHLSHGRFSWVHPNCSDRPWDRQVAAITTTAQVSALVSGRYQSSTAYTLPTLAIADAFCPKKAIIASLSPQKHAIGKPAKRYYGTR